MKTQTLKIILILLVSSALASMTGYQFGKQHSERIAAESFLVGVRVAGQLVQADPKLRYPLEIERASLKYVLNVPRGRRVATQTPAPTPNVPPPGSMHVTEGILRPVPPREMELVLDQIDR